MGSRWTAEQVLALAADASSAAAACTLAGPARWSGTGESTDPPLVWGECQGSGTAPYRAAVDVSGPAYSCSCPSRKFPCKHALGLLLLWSAAGVPAGEPPPWAASWAQGRADRAAKGTDRAAAGESERPPDADAARRRSERRDRRMATGLAELGQWLHDQIRTGLAGTERAGYRPFDTLAARMVDAQLPGVAGRVRRLAGVAASGEGWPGRLLEEYALLHLLVRAGATLLAGTAPPAGAPDADTVRAHLGVPVATADVLATPPVRDRWAVLAQQDAPDERLSVRRTWLRGVATGRPALVLSFAPAGGSLDATLTPGTTLDADVHFYPGAPALRALVGARHAAPEPGVDAAGAGGPVTAALQEWAGVLSLDPWAASWPVLLAEVVPVHDDGGWWLVDAAGEQALPVHGIAEAAWVLLAVAGGRPVRLLAEVSARGARPVAVLPSAGPAGPTVARPVVL
jgi:hypothetical protein